MADKSIGMREALEYVAKHLSPESDLMREVSAVSFMAHVHGHPSYTGVTLADLLATVRQALKEE